MPDEYLVRLNIRFESNSEQVPQGKSEKYPDMGVR